MNAVDLWLVAAAVLFALALVFGFVATGPRAGNNPRMAASRVTSLPLMAGGLLCWVIAELVARHN